MNTVGVSTRRRVDRAKQCPPSSLSTKHLALSTRRRLRRLTGAGVGVLTAGLARAAEEAPRAPGVDASGMFKLIGGLALVVLLIFFLSWLLKRTGRFAAPGGGRLRVLAGVQVGHRERVVLLKAGDKQLLVGVAPGRVQTLHVLDEPIEGFDEPSGQALQGSPFAQRLHQMMRQHEKRR